MSTQYKYILVAVFAVIFGFIVNDGLRLAVQSFFQISTTDMGLIVWGDSPVIWRVVVSLVGSAATGFIFSFITGVTSKKYALAMSIPVMLFWFLYSPTLLGLIIIILTPLIIYGTTLTGSDLKEQEMDLKRLLGIHWLNWLWIFPFALNAIVFTVSFFVLLLIGIDAKFDASAGYHPHPLIALLVAPGMILSRVVALFALFGSFIAASNLYELLKQERKSGRDRIGIFLYVLGFHAVFWLLTPAVSDFIANMNN